MGYIDNLRVSLVTKDMNSICQKHNTYPIG